MTPVENVSLELSELREECPGHLRNPVCATAGIAVDVRVGAVEGAYFGRIACLAAFHVVAEMGA